MARADLLQLRLLRAAAVQMCIRDSFETVEFVEVTPETLEAAVEDFSRRIGDSDIPSDGLVLLYDDIAYRCV